MWLRPRQSLLEQVDAQTEDEVLEGVEELDQNDALFRSGIFIQKSLTNCM